MATTTNNGWTTPDDTGYVKDGALAIRTLGSAIDTSVGKGLLAWVAFTPTWSGITKGTGATENYYYCTIGKTTIVRGSLTFGTGGAVTAPAMTLPTSIPNLGVTAKYDYGIWVLSAGGVQYKGTVNMNNTPQMTLVAENASGTYTTLTAVSATVPTTWAATHQLYFQFIYESA